MLLHRNLRNGTFEEVSKPAGLADMPLQSRRGAAFGDIANDGNVDIVVLNVGEPPSLLLNTNQSPNHRVLFHLVGTKSNRAAIGARVTIRAGGMTQFDEVRGGGSYLSQNDLRLHFGLGSATKIDSVEVRWPSGKTESFKNVATAKIYFPLTVSPHNCRSSDCGPIFNWDHNSSALPWLTPSNRPVRIPALSETGETLGS